MEVESSNEQVLPHELSLFTSVMSSDPFNSPVHYKPKETEEQSFE